MGRGVGRVAEWVAQLYVTFPYNWRNLNMVCILGNNVVTMLNVLKMIMVL